VSPHFLAGIFNGTERLAMVDAHLCLRMDNFVQQRRAVMTGREEEESDVEIDGMEL